MVPQPEQKARKEIDQLLIAAGWSVCDPDKTNIHGARGVAIREFPLKSPSPLAGEGRGEGYGFADYLLYVDGKAAGVIEAKKEGVTLTGVETQAAKYIQGLPDGLPRWANPLPFFYQVDANLKRAERLRQAVLGKAFSGLLVQHDHTVAPKAANQRRA